MSHSEAKASFWDHLDVLRGVILRALAVTVIFSIVAFMFKDQIFALVFAPKNSDFITYRLLADLGAIIPGGKMPGFEVNVINTALAQQFLIHVKTAFCFGLLLATPYILYQIFMFVSPALYDNERRYAIRMVSSGYLMFMLGVLLGYFLIFPLTFRFLGTYQVDSQIANMITLDSYMSTLIMICLSMGIVFEMPVLCWLLGRMGVINDGFMRQYRRHAIVLILLIAAIITPTSDIFTLLAVSAPMILLYEISIFLVHLTTRHDVLSHSDE